MSTERRLLVVLLIVLAVAVPAVVLRVLCAGRSCQRAMQANTRVPYCSLAKDARELIASGFRDGRSPHVLAMTGGAEVKGSTALSGAPAWPSAMIGDEQTVPLVFSGAGVAPGTSVPKGTTLDAVAPTVAEAIRLRRPHPGVRSGEAVGGVAGGRRPKLVLLVAWRGLGTEDLRAKPRSWPQLRRLLRAGAGTLEAMVGSVPLDPGAVLTTIGTGGLPRDHGMTGTLVRNENGQVVEAWGPSTPFSVIAALGDDLDRQLRQEPRIGVVGGYPTDRGLIGGNWYVEHDRDDALFPSQLDDEVRAGERLLASGYGRDDVPDLLAVALEGEIEQLDAALGQLAEAADRAAEGRAMVVVTATGSTAPHSDALSAERVEREVNRKLNVEVVEATALGGVFVDQEVLADTGLSVDRVASAMRDLRAPNGSPLFADVFPQVAVTFAKYC